PLRDRPEDIAILAAHFARKYSRPNQPAPEITPEAMKILLDCPWPGNVRQLENAIERSCVTARNGIIGVENLPPDVGGKIGGMSELTIDLTRPLGDQLNELTAKFEE